MLTGAALVVEGVALTLTLTEAGLVGAAVLLGARVASEVSAPVSVYRAAHWLRLDPCVHVSFMGVQVERDDGDVH